jgi:hypothetical protein
LIGYSFIALERKNQQLGGFQSIGILLKDDELDILELFAQTKTLTTMQIRDLTKSTKLGKTYKNIYKKVKHLEKQKLIEYAGVEKTRNNEKPFKLTDDGIYQLLLKRLYGILLDQLSIKKGQPHISYVSSFLRHYAKNRVFELFLYPYFEEQTISIDNFDLLRKLFGYVSDCCKGLETSATASRIVLLFHPKFSWNNVPGKDDRKVLESLKEIGTFERLDEAKIEKSQDNKMISVTTPEDYFTIKLNTQAHKANVSINRIMVYEYKINQLGSEITVGTTQKLEDPIRSTVERSRKIVEPYIFELVSTLEQDNMKVLAHDTKFMLVLDDMNTRFKNGYNTLMEFRQKSQ